MNKENNGSDKMSNLIQDLLNCPDCRSCSRRPVHLGCQANLRREAAGRLKEFVEMEKAPSLEA